MDSKVSVRQGDNQIGKEKDKAIIAKEANKAKKTKEDNEVRVHSGIGDQAI